MRARAIAAATATALVLGVAAAAPASAEPSTVTSFPPGASGTTFAGRAFDACAAPSAGAIQAWGASPYRAVAVYLGGLNRGCSQPNLTSGWVTSVARLGWRIIPVYVGRQAPCADDQDLVEITASTARTQGTAEAADAVAQARALGLRPGSAVYSDIENYSTLDAGCRVAVLQYLSGWTRELHRQGYVSGVYANVGSGVLQLSGAYTSTSYARPDAVWGARWDGSSSLTSWPGISSTRWTVHQRGKQYVGDHTETWGGVSIRIDSDQFDGPVATALFAQTVISLNGLNARSGPTVAYPVVHAYPHGSALPVVCQAPGGRVGTSAVWDRLSDGSYVSDLYLSTPSKTTYSSPIPRCRYPYQVAATPSLRRHSAPSPGASSPGSIWDGGLAWVSCQAAGTKVGSTVVWDRLDDGSYVSDYYLGTASNTTWTGPAPRC